MKNFEVVAEGFLFPEGPVVFPDGSVVLVDMLRGDLVRAWNGNRIEVIAHLGGGPNGAALGPDGAIYVCNNGGLAWHKDEAGLIVIPGFAPSDYEGGWIERVDLSTGRSERLYTQVDGHPLIGPNDLVFDEEGAFWFTDTGKIQARTRHLSNGMDPFPPLIRRH